MPLSQKQCEYLALAWQCMETEPKIDYEKFREIAGLASAHSARELMRVTKKKLREEYGAPLATNGRSSKSANSSPAKPKSVSTPRKPTTNAVNGSSGKKASTSNWAATNGAKRGIEIDDDDDDDDEKAMARYDEPPTPSKKPNRSEGSNDASARTETVAKRIKTEPDERRDSGYDMLMFQ